RPVFVPELKIVRQRWPWRSPRRGRQGFYHNLLTRGTPLRVSLNTVIAQTIASARSGDFPLTSPPPAIIRPSSASSSGNLPAKNALPASNLSAIGSALAHLPREAWTSRTFNPKFAALITLSTIAPPLLASATISCVFHRAAAAATRLAQPSGLRPRTVASSSTNKASPRDPATTIPQASDF